MSHQFSRKSEIKIDLDDVVRAGGVEQALAAWCEDSEDVASGIIGPSFATSGPGSGWTIEFTEAEYARRAMEGGALYYLDTCDGRLASAPEWTDELYAGQPIKWTEESVVELVCPAIDEAVKHPREVADMARAVIAHHSPESDTGDWRSIIEQVRRLTEELEGIDTEDLPQ